ncbi:MAG: flagellin FliC [Chloroflexi bacterium]|nr:flagellin FliC [Chloroflexota bacterium]
MALRINYNYESISAQRNLTSTQGSFFKAIEQLSSGLRINKAADDAAGLAVSEKLKNQVRGLNQAQRNAQDGISLLQTAEGALNETHSLLARMRELAVQSANDTLTNDDRLHIQDEVNALLSEVDRISNATQFNKISLLTGNGVITGLNLHIGANVEPTTPDGSNQITVSISASGTSSLGVDVIATSGAISLTTQSGANSAISALDTAIETVSTTRGQIGAYQNRLDSMINSLGVASENAGAANSRIRDADVAKSVSEMVRTQILQQSTMAVLAQANQAPQMALQLLK